MRVRDAKSTDGEAILKLVPRLAAFDVPENRQPRDLYDGDEKMLRDWLAGHRDNCLVQVAETDDNVVVGYTFTRLRPDMLSGTPSAHLEAIAVADGAEGQGVGQALLEAVEENSQANGAQSVTLHVISTNSRARAFYERSGYSGELLRYIKEFDQR